MALDGTQLGLTAAEIEALGLTEDEVNALGLSASQIAEEVEIVMSPDIPPSPNSKKSSPAPAHAAMLANTPDIEVGADAAAHLEDMAKYESETLKLAEEIDKIDIEEDADGGWRLTLDAAAEVLRCDAKTLSWLAVTWEAPGQLGLKIAPRETIGSAKTGGVISAVRPGLPAQIVPGLVFVALNGELVLNMEYDILMSCISSSKRPLTIQFIQGATLP